MSEQIKWTTEKRKIEELKPAEYNPRQATQKQAEDLKQSLDKFALAAPIIINLDNTIIGGHFRYSIMKEEGQKTVDVRVPNRQLTKAEEKELNVRLNKNVGSWDYEGLANFEEDVLMQIGFEPKELDDIFGIKEKKKDPDKVPEVPKKATAKMGEVYQLGDHRVMCGDSTKKEDAAKLMGKDKIEMLFTDPPYNVNYKGTGKDTSRTIENDNLTPEKFKEFLDEVFERVEEHMQEGAIYYVCSGWSSYPVMHQSIIDAGLHRSGVIIWKKDTASMGWNDFRYKHEWIIVGKKKRGKTRSVSILYGWKRGTHYFRDTRDEYDVWEIPKKFAGNYLHPTEKPVWLIEKALANSSKRNAIVADFFGGSGSTLIACERIGRKARLMEHDPLFVDVIIKRWEDFTGKKAVKIEV